MLFRHRVFLCLALAGILSLSTRAAMAQRSVPNRALAIVNVTVIPMDRDRALSQQTVIVRDGIIDSIVPANQAETADQLTLIDGTGRFLLPGMSDLHVHLLHEDEFVNYLWWGVTTIMHLGGTGMTGNTVLNLRKQIRSGNRWGPTIYTTNKVLDGKPRLNSRSIELTEPGAAHQAVRDLKNSGFDFIKIYNNIAQSEFDAIIDESRKVGMPVFGHIPRGFDALYALANGQNAIAHTEELFFSYFGGPRSTDENMAREYQPDLTLLEPLIEIMLDNDVATMPDLSFTFTDLLMWDDLDLLWNDDEHDFLHPETSAMWQRGNINRRSGLENFVVREQWKYELLLLLTRKFQESGILQVVGTDASLPGLYPGKAVHRELTELVKAGLSNFEALSIATRNAGIFARRYLDSDARFGQIKPGFRADLLLLDRNPLLDVRNARQIHGVMSNGRYQDRQALAELRDKLKERYTLHPVAR